MKDNFQIPIINNLRGFAALSVCLFHFVCGTVNYINDATTLKIATFGYYGVQLFFVISGIVIPLSLLKSNFSLLKFPTFFLKRIIRIEPTYIIAIITSLLILAIKHNLNQVSISQITLHLGYLIPFYLNKYKWLNEVFWTLAIEFQYYLIISILILLVIKNQFIGRLLFYACFLVMPFIFDNPNFFLMYAPIFLIGCNFCLFFLNKTKVIEFITVFIIAIIVTCLKIGITDAIIATVAICIIHLFKNYSNKLLNFFGTISYSFYLFHTIIGAAIVNVLSHKFVQVWQKPIVILAGISVTIILSYIIYILIEKPTHTLSKKIKY